MSSNVPINPSQGAGITAPTPQNTPLTNQAPIAGLSRPTVPDIKEEDEGAATAGNDPVNMQNTMLGLVHGRLANLVGRSSGYIENLPLETKRRVEALKGVQVKQTELQNQYKYECFELEKKYLELSKPLYERRSAIIDGTGEPTPEEITAGEVQSVEDDPDYKSLPAPTGEEASSSPGKGIPEFWLTALRNHIGLAELITERDEAALKSLLDIRLSYLDTKREGGGGKPGFVISFVFAPNDYFTNEILTKTYVYQAEVGYGGDFVYDHAEGTEIKWKEDKDLTKEFEIKKQRNKNTNRTRLVRKARPTESFFNFFTPPVGLTEEQMNSDDIDDDVIEENEEKLELDYQIGEDFKEKIIPRAVDYFTGKALEYDMVGESDDDDDYEDIDDDEELDSDEDDDDDDDSDSDDVPIRRRGGAQAKGGRRAGGGAAAGNANTTECPNQ